MLLELLHEFLLDVSRNEFVACKLREEHITCASITVFAHTSRFCTDVPQNYIQRTINLPVPTNDLQEIVSVAVNALRDEWKDGAHYYYKKAGVIVWNTCSDKIVQGNLFDEVDRAKQSVLAKTVDEINRKNGHNTIRIAVQGYNKNWHLKNEYISKQYTTNLNDIITAKAK